MDSITKTASSKQDILKKDQIFNEFCSVYPILPGSILRTKNSNYGAWGIKIGDENQNWLFEQSEKEYAKEWEESDDSLNKLVAEASKKAGLGDVNLNLNKKVAELAVDEMEKQVLPLVGNSQKKDKTLRIADIGKGEGATSLAFLSELSKSIEFVNLLKNNAINLELYLIEPSEKRMHLAIDQISTFFQQMEIAKNPISIHKGISTEINYLYEFEENFFDLIISNATIHHHSFDRHIHEISRVLKKGHSFINGDWYNSMWEKPERVYWLLVAMEKTTTKEDKKEIFNLVKGKFNQVKKQILRPLVDVFSSTFHSQRLSKIQNIFGFKDRGQIDSIMHCFHGLSKDECLANAGIMNFWLSCAEIFKNNEKKCPIWFIEGHERVSSRLQNFANAGLFLSDAKDMREKHDCFVKIIPQYGELACVMKLRKEIKH